MSLIPNKLLTIHWLDESEIVSCLQKGIRQGWEDALLYAAELIRSGKPGYVWNRMFIIDYEDNGYVAAEKIKLLIKMYLEFKKGVKEEEGGKLTNVWRNEKLVILTLQAVKMLLDPNSVKTRIASNVGPGVYTDEFEELVRKEELGEKKVKLPSSLESLSEFKKYKGVWEDIIQLWISLEEKNEVLALYHSTRLVQWEGEFEAEKKETKSKELPFPRGEWLKVLGKRKIADTRITPVLIIWAILAEALKENKKEKSFFDACYEISVVEKKKGMLKLIIYSLIFYHCRFEDEDLGSQPVEKLGKFEKPAWFDLMFSEHTFESKNEVLAIRKYFNIRSVCVDKHTRWGKGLDTLNFLNSVLDDYNITWLSEEEKKRSHRRPEDLPAENKTSRFFNVEGAKVFPEAKIDNPYKEIAHRAYLEAEKKWGVKKAKTKFISKDFYDRKMKGYAKKEPIPMPIPKESKVKTSPREEKKKVKLSPREEKKKIKSPRKIREGYSDYSLEEFLDSGTGQKRTGRNKKYVFIPDKEEKDKIKLVFKGPYYPKVKGNKGNLDKVLLVIQRSLIFQAWGTKMLLPILLKREDGENYIVPYYARKEGIITGSEILKQVKKFYDEQEIYIASQNLSEAPASEWISKNYEESFEQKKDEGKKTVKIFTKESLGLRPLGKIFSEAKDAKVIKGKISKELQNLANFLSVQFPSLFDTLLQLYLLGVGDVQLGNNLQIEGTSTWLWLDYEDNIGKDTEVNTIDTVLFRGKQSSFITNIFRCCFRVFKKEITQILNNVLKSEDVVELLEEFGERKKVEGRLKWIKKLFSEFYE